MYAIGAILLLVAVSLYMLSILVICSWHDKALLMIGLLINAAAAVCLKADGYSVVVACLFFIVPLWRLPAITAYGWWIESDWFGCRDYPGMWQATILLLRAKGVRI